MGFLPAVVASVVFWICESAAYQFQLDENQKPVTMDLDLNDEEVRRLNNLVALMNTINSRRQNTTTYEPETSVEDAALDSWSVVWYIASFGGLIAFFLVVSCSEWCCRKASRRANSFGASASQTNTPSADTPPPSYDHFAPPSYDSLSYAGGSAEKREFDIYVVPVHALQPIIENRRVEAVEELPPSYASAGVGGSWRRGQGVDNPVRVEMGT